MKTKQRVSFRRHPAMEVSLIYRPLASKRLLCKVGVSSSAFRHPTTDRQHNGCSAHLSPILGAEVGIPGARELTQLTTLLGRQHQAGKGSTRGVCCKDNLTGGTLVPVLLAPLATRQICVCAPAFATCGLGSITSPICISCGFGSIL